ncbi:hypothetical protein CAPTEDRAFT_191618 [Capitella teleta]|uniref:BET1 homolog n=1 Tax=Capitella teleta TaxID=283909 RepID=R7UUE2_CAPTE|nr:hypothetical protein CAPTEDRAFT_191618 [Capitella teleta]|eukprot:ELU09788.1 hypothetical protein CAPTEDRAFT_191618 [Capitella teleta]
MRGALLLTFLLFQDEKHDANNYGTKYGQQTSSHIEEENEQLTGQLSDKVRALKSLTIDIGHEVRESNKLISDMDNDFDKTTGFLQRTMGRVTAMARAGHHRFIWYLLAFSLFVFFVIWILTKAR